MRTVIIDYGAGNVQSIQFALERLGHTGVLSQKPAEIRAADKVIFPGVGEASSAMNHLRKTGLEEVIPTLEQPVLGICLGMQLMCRGTAEGTTKGMGIFDVDVLEFKGELKVPHIGWNRITDLRSELFQGIHEREFMYLVHSFYAPLCRQTIAQCTYGSAYSSALQQDNFFGVQFHPEKSSAAGEKIIENFLNL